MNTTFLSLAAAALTGVLSLVSYAAKPTDGVVQLRIDLDRTMLRKL